MKGTIFVIVLIIAGVVGLGFYMGWFEMSSKSDDNKASVTLSVDRGKLQEDKDKGASKVEDAGEQLKDKAESTAEKLKK